jgi:hypothetical protein
VQALDIEIEMINFIGKVQRSLVIYHLHRLCEPVVERASFMETVFWQQQDYRLDALFVFSVALAKLVNLDELTMIVKYQFI